MPENPTNLERVIAKNPTSSLFARLADALLQKGELNRAVEVCRQGLRYRPSYVSGHVVLGKCHFAACKFDEARRAFNKALHLDPCHTVAIYFLGRIDRTMGWDDLALRNFQKARELDPLSANLGTAIDDVLTSISSLMGRNLQDACAADAAGRESSEFFPEGASGSAFPEGDRVDPVGPSTAAQDAGGRDAPADRTPLPVPEDPADDPAELLVTTPEGPPHPGRPEISILLGEISVGSRPSGSDADWLPSSSHAPPGNGFDIPPPGPLPAPDLLKAVHEPIPTTVRRGRRQASDTPDAVKRPGRGRGRESPRTEPNKPRGGPVWESFPIATATLGELYAGQGFIAQAILVLGRVLEREPGNSEVQARLLSLRNQLHACEKEVHGARPGDGV